jgi:hypothetical protein
VWRIPQHIADEATKLPLMRIGMCGVLCLLLAWTASRDGLAQSAGHHHEFHTDHYRTWQRPDVGGSCCNARLREEEDEEIGDCEPTTAEIRGDRWFAWLREQARWVEIPHEVILREINPSPEKAHLCFAYERVLCFLPPHSGG